MSSRNATQHELRKTVAGTLAALFDIATPIWRRVRARWHPLVDGTLSLPGDELVREPKLSWTHDIEIEAPAADVWRVLVQLGQHDPDSDNAAARRELVPGARMRLDASFPALVVSGLQAGSWLVLVDDAPLERPLQLSWLLRVQELERGRCRLSSHVRAMSRASLCGERPPWIHVTVAATMDRSVLRAVKRRAERTARLTAGYAGCD